MAFWMNGPPMAPIARATANALPHILAQRQHLVVEGVPDRDPQRVTIDSLHHSAKIIPVVRAAFPDVELPLVDHLVGKGANQLRKGLLDEEGEGKADEAMIAFHLSSGASWGAGPLVGDEHARRGGQAPAPENPYRRKLALEIAGVQLLPEALELLGSQRNRKRRGPHGQGKLVARAAGEGKRT